MTSLFSSHRALEALAALEQRGDGGLRLAEVAAAVGAPVSSTQVALGVLIDDGLVSVSTARPPLYRIAPRADEDATKILDVAARRAARERLLVAALRASRAIEFAGLDEAGLLLVLRWDAEPSDEVLLERMLRRIGLEVCRFGHDEVRARLRDDGSSRQRATTSRVIVGSVDRSFPRPFRHGSPDAQRLGGLNPAIVPPSHSALARLARRFGLSEIRVFGSAVHVDFRPDSDIDVMVRRKPGVPRTLEGELSLRRALEDLLGRDVDVFDASVLRRPIRERAQSDGVVLYG
jgi:predicted nucleotidyltransferase